jgi:single-stranded DNA-binding protein
VGLNIAILMGEVVTDPQNRTVNDKPITAFRINDGKATHNVSVFEAPQGIVKGTVLAVQGRLNNRNMAKKDEQARWITEVTCSGTNVTVVSGGAATSDGDELDFG